MPARRVLVGCNCTIAIPAVFGVAYVAQLFTTFLFYRSLPRRVLLSSPTVERNFRSLYRLRTSRAKE